MSYSRWGNSRWYSYWRIQADGVPRDKQEFAVDTLFTMGRITYGDMKADFESAVGRFVKDQIEQEPDFAPDAEEVAELKGYMREFMCGVEVEFGSQGPEKDS